MARKKRPYVPKVKGCYECSQRRINCDGTRPSCSKCVSRGISCSGFDIKYRFRDGLPQLERTTKRNRSISFRQDCVQLNTSPKPRLSRSTENSAPDNGKLPTQGILPATQFDVDIVSSDETHGWGTLVTLPLVSLHSRSPSSTEMEMESSPEVVKSTSQAASPLLSRFRLGQLQPQTEFLLTYCKPSRGPKTLTRRTNTPSVSNKIAPEMVVLDDDNNGWRHLVLPMARTSEVMMSAVLAASAFHLSGRDSSQQVADPHRLYGQAIRELQHRRDLTGCDRGAKQFVIMAIVVLLVAVMINGCSDFPIIFQMLESALSAVGGEIGLLDGGEMAQFSLRQIRKLRVYAAPLLSQDAGLHAMIYRAEESFDCLHYYDQLHPKQSPMFKAIANIRQQAFDIYLDSALPKSANATSEAAIDRFVSSVQEFPEGTPGEHVLIWPVFIAASGSSTLEHQKVFQEFLERQYHRNGFFNILRGLELLKRIWGRTTSEDWPALLPEPQVFIM